MQRQEILRIQKSQPIPSDPLYARYQFGILPLIPRLAKQGFVSHVVPLHPQAHPVSDKPILRSFTRLEMVQFDKDNPNLVWILPPTIRTRSSIINEACFAVTATLTVILLWLSKRIHFTVIYSTNTFFLGLVGGITKVITRARWIAELADPRPPEFYQGVKGLIFKLVERAVFSLNPDAVLAVDPVLAKQVGRRYRRNVIFHPTCYSEGFKRKVSPAELLDFKRKYDLLDKIIILYAGTLHPKHSRVDILANVASELVKENPKIRFVIASSSKDGLNMLERMAADLKITDYFVFLGTLPHERMPLIVQACDISININYLFNIGAKVIEGMASGKPTVSAAPWYDQYDQLLLNGYNTILVPLSTIAIRDAILKLISDDAYRQRIAENGYNTIKQYDYDYEDRFYKKLLFPDIDLNSSSNK